MSLKLGNGLRINTLSTEKLMHLYENPPRAKDKVRIERVLNRRGVNASQEWFKRKLKGPKEFEVGELVWIKLFDTDHIVLGRLVSINGKQSHCTIKLEKEHKSLGMTESVMRDISLTLIFHTAEEAKS